MEKFEQLILRWVCLFDDFKNVKYSNIKSLVSSEAFKSFANDVFCLKCSTSSTSEDENLYNTIKMNYNEFEVQKYENLNDDGNSFYTCVVVLLHALLKCTNNIFRDQLSERMNNEEQVLLATFLEATQSSLFTKENISEALMLINSAKHSSFNTSEIFSNNTTPIKSKSTRRSYLQEFCESPKSQSLIYQEKEKLIAKLKEEYKNECEENYKLAENIKTLQDLNIKLNNKLEDKDKIIKYLKDEIEEISKPKDCLEDLKIDNGLKIKKLNQDILDLEINNNELKQQITELENNFKVLNEKFETKTSDYKNLLSLFDNIENENMSLKENMNLLKESLQKKDTEIISLKDELCNKSISTNPINSSIQEANIVPSNTLFDELSCLKLEEVTHDKEKYRHKYKSTKKELLNTENQVKDLGDQITTLKQQLHDCEADKTKLANKFSDKKKELQECQKKNSNLETKVKHLKDSIKDKENYIESMCSKLDKKENQIKELSVELDTVKKSKLMIDLILSKTNAEIETLHEENNKYVNDLLAIIEDNKNTVQSSQENIDELKNNLKTIQDDLGNKEQIIIFYEEKMAENYQVINHQEDQLKIMYEEKIMLESHLKKMKTEMENQQKVLEDKNHEMEVCLEYYLDELKDIKTTKTNMEEILRCKQNEVDRQVELINYQKSLIETLQSEKCSKEIDIIELNDRLQMKTTENINFEEKVRELTLNLDKLKEEHNIVLTEKTMLEKNKEMQIEKLSKEFQQQICDMKKVLENRNHEINQLKMNCYKLKEDLEIKQDNFNDQLCISNKHIETVCQLRLEMCELVNSLKSTNQDLITKENEIKSMNSKLNLNTKEILDLAQKVDLKKSENQYLTKTLDFVLSSVNDMQNNFDKSLVNINNPLQLYNEKINIQTDKLIKLENYLLSIKSELQTQIDSNNKQKEHILVLETEKFNLLEKLKASDELLMNKDIEVGNLEKELQRYNLTVTNLEEKLGIMSIEKVIIETNLNETTEELKKSQELSTEQINNHITQLSNCKKEIMHLKNQSLDLRNTLEKKQKELDEQLKVTLKQSEILKSNELEKEILEKQVTAGINAQARIESLLEELNECKSTIEKLEKNLENSKLEKNTIETRLKNIIEEKESANLEFNKNIKDVQNCLSELKNDLNNKQIQFELAIEENIKLKESFDYTENQCINLKNELEMLNDCILKKDENLKELKAQISEYSISNENLTMQVIQIKQNLNDEHCELENQIKWCNEQREMIVQLNCEKESLCDEIKNLEETLSHKEYEFNLCEGKLYDCSNTIDSLEIKIEEMKKENSSLKLDFDKTVLNLTNENKNLTQHLEVECQNLLEIQKKIILIQDELDKHIKQSNEQLKTISLLNVEKESLLIEINKLQECMNEKQNSSDSLRKIANDYKKEYEELLTLKTNLESEIDLLKTQLINVQQESKHQLSGIENKYSLIEEQLKEKQNEIDEYISKYNCQSETISVLTSERDNLINENNSLKNTISNNDSIIEANQKKLLEYEKLNTDMKAKNVGLELELKQINTQLSTTRQDLTHQIEENEKNIFDLQQEINSEHINLDAQLKKATEQVEVISILTSERDNLINERNALQNRLLENEDTLASNHKKLITFETQLEELQTQKICLESKLNDLKIQSNNTQHDLTEKLETTKTKLQDVEEQLSKLQVDFEKQNQYLNVQTELINTLTSEKNNLICETTRLEDCIAQTNSAMSSIERKLENKNEQNTKIECQNTSLMFELNQLKDQLNNLRQESSKQIIEMDKKLCEAQEQLNHKQNEIKKQIILKNDSLTDIYQKINDLKSIKNELELVFKKEKTDFENCLEICSNYSSNNLKHQPVQDEHQDSLMEVICSADTFIEQNGIQLVKVDNYDEYSIIEKLKKLFEALKMFIININTQGNERAIKHSNIDEYAELLTKSNKQLETIKRLESEMSDLKSECNYKMTKVQQKTQEYVTAEYEKKFERKREQMKQFCKDLETKIHQDYEAKLMKYKEKIKKDEIHIKELGHQLWEVSEKYLKLQQKDRRESTMSLPYEISTISQTTNAVPKFNSFTLPKSSSAGQIRSLVEETTRSHQDNSKRNVPVGIGKKFSLSSGKIFPKEEDEEGEMFNHSCLADLKQGKVRLNDNYNQLCNERLSELQARNSLCPPHLRSCYAVETNFLPNSSLITEEDIKTLANYSDCESENLIPNDRNKKKDRNQTSYKKPGPPTPSKNGGRASLSGNTKIPLKEPKESSSNNKKRLSSTPNKLFSLFMSKKN